MAAETAHTPAIMGDVIFDDMAVTQKSNLLTATLKKSHRRVLGSARGHLDGALLQFEEGVACVLIAPSGPQGSEHEAHQFRVTRVSAQRFVVDLVGENTSSVDPVIQAALLLLQDQIKKGQRGLLTEGETKGVFQHLAENASLHRSQLDQLLETSD